MLQKFMLVSPNDMGTVGTEVAQRGGVLQGRVHVGGMGRGDQGKSSAVRGRGGGRGHGRGQPHRDPDCSKKMGCIFAKKSVYLCIT